MKQRLKPAGGITIPREFVLMNRAAVGLGAVFLHLKAELNFHRMFEAEIDDFGRSGLQESQRAALTGAALA